MKTLIYFFTSCILIFNMLSLLATDEVKVKVIPAGIFKNKTTKCVEGSSETYGHQISNPGKTHFTAAVIQAPLPTVEWKPYAIDCDWGIVCPSMPSLSPSKSEESDPEKVDFPTYCCEFSVPNSGHGYEWKATATITVGWELINKKVKDPPPPPQKLKGIASATMVVPRISLITPSESQGGSIPIVKNGVSDATQFSYENTKLNIAIYLAVSPNKHSELLDESLFGTTFYPDRKSGFKNIGGSIFWLAVKDGIPSQNNGFGLKKFSVIFDKTNPYKKETGAYQFFNPENFVHFSGGQSVPNWFHYWLQLTQYKDINYGTEPVMEYPNSEYFAQYNPATGKISLFNAIMNTDGCLKMKGVRAKGIDCFLLMAEHESYHKNLHEFSLGDTDSDSDRVGISDEMAFFTEQEDSEIYVDNNPDADPFFFSSHFDYSNFSPDYQNMNDDEIITRSNTNLPFTLYEKRNVDWSYNGQQWKAGPNYIPDESEMRRMKLLERTDVKTDQKSGKPAKKPLMILNPSTVQDILNPPPTSKKSVLPLPHKKK